MQPRGYPDWSARLHVDEHGSIGLTTAAGKVVHAQHPQRECDRIGGGAHQAQQRRAADGEVKALSKPRTGTPTEGETKVRHIGALRVGAAGMDSGEAGEAFGEDGTRARGDTTDEATDMEMEGDSLSGTGAIREVAPVTTVDTGRAATTDRTGSSAPGRVDGEDDAPVIVGKIVKAKADEVWEELRETHE